MAIKTIILTRNIRDSIYDRIKDLTNEEQIKFYKLQASKLNKKLQKNKEKE